MIAECTYRHTERWEGFMKYAVEMGSGAMIYILSFKKIGSATRNVDKEDTQTHRHHGDLISLLLFFQEKESRLKTNWKTCRI
jgi:hypothetical protein